jgi:hypothetical protein
MIGWVGTWENDPLVSEYRQILVSEFSRSKMLPRLNVLPMVMVCYVVYAHNIKYIIVKRALAPAGRTQKFLAPLLRANQTKLRTVPPNENNSKDPTVVVRSATPRRRHDEKKGGLSARIASPLASRVYRHRFLRASDNSDR